MYFRQCNYLGGSDADDDLGFRFGSSPQASTPWLCMEPKIVPMTTTLFGGLSGSTVFPPYPNIKPFLDVAALTVLVAALWAVKGSTGIMRL